MLDVCELGASPCRHIPEHLSRVIIQVCSTESVTDSGEIRGLIAAIRGRMFFSDHHSRDEMQIENEENKALAMEMGCRSSSSAGIKPTIAL